MSFYYVLELKVSDHRANAVVNMPEIIELFKKANVSYKIENGKFVVSFPENEELDEELVKSLVEALKMPVEVVEYIVENGKEIEVFKGKLSPREPLGKVVDELKERTIEEEEEVEEKSSEGSEFDDMYDLDSDDMEMDEE